MRGALRAVLIVLGWLPLPVLHAMGALVGALAGLLPNRARTNSRIHVRMAFPQLGEAERERIVRASLRHMVMTILEAPAIWFGPRARLLRWVDHAATLAQLRSLGARGAILLCPHVGSWELAGMVAAAAGPVSSLYKPQKGEFDALIKEGRERLGARLVPSTLHGVKALMEALRRREAIGILPDQDPPWGSGVFAPLFGTPAHTTGLVGKLAARAGAAVWFLFTERLPWGRGFRVHLYEAPAGVADAQEGPAALNRAVEEVIRKLPGQYWWSYRRYRRRPPGEPSIYT